MKSLFLFSLLMTSTALAQAPSPQVTVRPADSGAALQNPGMGWVFHHYDNSINGYGPPLGPGYDGREFPGLTQVYLRLAWSHLEPQEGKFNWAILDTPIARYAAAGKRFSFRFTAFEGDPKQGTPAWVRAAGAKGYEVETYGIKSWEPDYDDALFLEKLGNFLNAVGRRYGDNFNLEFVDVGTLGIWGEGHPIARKYNLATLRRHIELHRRVFPKTLLVANDDWNTWFAEAGRATPLELSRELGLTLRDDSICVYPDPKQNYSAHLAQPFWPSRPVILEMGHYDYAKTHGAWGDGARYLQAVEDYRASYVSIHANPVIFLKENAGIIARINRRVGYRFNLVQASWPQSVKNDEIEIASSWRNVGAAPCYAGGFVAWSLVDAKGNLCAVLTDDWNVRELPPDAPATEKKTRFALPPQLAAGEYEVRVSLGDSSGVPRYQLPLESDDGSRRYRLGKITIEK